MSTIVASTGRTLPPKLEQTLARVTEIGLLPDVTVRVIEVVEDPRATAKAIYDVVQTDPALATKILKLVNSAFYGLPAQVASLERGIVMLGLRVVKNLALAASLARLLKEDQISDEFSTRDLWRHSVAVGVCAKLLVRTGQCVPGDEAFVAGLVHDIGLIVEQQLFRAPVREVAELCLEQPQSFCGAEQIKLGADHATIGGALAAKWRFPPVLRHAIAYHHDPRSLQPEFQKVAALVYLADTICCRERYGFWLTARSQELAGWMLDLVGLTAADMEQVAGLVPVQLAEAEQIFAMA